MWCCQAARALAAPPSPRNGGRGTAALRAAAPPRGRCCDSGMAQRSTQGAPHIHTNNRWKQGLHKGEEGCDSKKLLALTTPDSEVMWKVTSLTTTASCIFGSEGAGAGKSGRGARALAPSHAPAAAAKQLDQRQGRSKTDPRPSGAKTHTPQRRNCSAQLKQRLAAPPRPMRAATHALKRHSRERAAAPRL